MSKRIISFLIEQTSALLQRSHAGGHIRFRTTAPPDSPEPDAELTLAPLNPAAASISICIDTETVFYLHIGRSIIFDSYTPLTNREIGARLDWLTELINLTINGKITETLYSKKAIFSPPLEYFMLQRKTSESPTVTASPVKSQPTKRQSPTRHTRPER